MSGQMQCHQNFSQVLDVSSLLQRPVYELLILQSCTWSVDGRVDLFESVSCN
jgi:hypothetical protein